ncbi:YhcN/YlaJ family sporulation lipoprotein [Halobacillus litoralis]|uniref:YhcN/YlaJ family sporulation lipoprotein n=1 Tax=Halobacillus litoralis TaxID=45668 RepID=UPI001CD6B6D7|nr:YhcN/YlaJ family sporulation lipoprotein [Halobacillus litoralis]MCA0969953.1 YhcN/YlaJ family sporulation lipoprotein [Halobacillus litoralis]
MWKPATLSLLLALSLAACGSDETLDLEKNTDKYEPLEYRADEGIERRGQIPTGEDSYFKRSAEQDHLESKYQNTSRGRDNAFNNEDSMEIVEKVNELKEVTLTQAFTTNDKVYIAVMVNPYDYRNSTISERVQQKAEEVTDKQTVIWINNNKWDNYKDMNARLRASEAPDEIKDKIMHFFKQDR